MTLLWGLVACQPPAGPPPEVKLDEVAPQFIALEGPAGTPEVEISGLAWLGERLLLLPQYPGFAGNRPSVYALSRASIEAALGDGSALRPEEIPLHIGGLQDDIRGFEGFESIAIDGDRVWVTVEASPWPRMAAWLVPGRFDGDAIVLDDAARVEIRAQSRRANWSDEASVWLGDELCTFYEGNAASINPHPVAHCFDADGAPTAERPMANLDFRLTDATPPDEEGRFWVVNYRYGAGSDPSPRFDALAYGYGTGPTHAESQNVERLVEMERRDGAFHLVDRAPVLLELREDGLGRNWEGVARLEGRGFLIVTDQHPGTLLALVEAP